LLLLLLLLGRKLLLLLLGRKQLLLLVLPKPISWTPSHEGSKTIRHDAMEAERVSKDSP
jgi:hypothetical protein